MLFDAFEQAGLLLNPNFKESASSSGHFAYRGDLVLQEGEVADAQGRRKPPVSAMRQVVALEQGGKLTMLIGSLDSMSDVPTLMARYAEWLTPQTRVLLFVINAKQNLLSEVAGISLEIVALPEGAVWTELGEMLGLEKSDFKGQSAGEKVHTVFGALLEHRSRSTTLPWADAVTQVTDARRQIHGAI